jgi:flagellar basal-body rod protein FlgB
MMERSDPQHIRSWKPMDYRDVQPRRVLDFTSTYNNDGNNVDPEVEVNKILENQMRYSLYAKAAAFEFSQVALVLRT